MTGEIDDALERADQEHFTREHLVPVPDVDTLADLNLRIEQIEVDEDARHIDNRPTSVGFDFDYEAPLLAPLPVEEFDVGLTLTPKVDKTSRITVRQNKYSVPARFLGQNVRVSLRADEVWVFERHDLVVRHPRPAGRYGFRDLLDHYLETCGPSPDSRAAARPVEFSRARSVHPGPRRVLGGRPRGQRPGGRHPGPDRRPPERARPLHDRSEPGE
ncbi:Mu transposase domain-containing protein [Streptomyces sp. NPDC050842]|uniref:Mu transposase domain-containing protein n=1 Tax=Streptomyces sp. NPDC050842 TaxID=3365636 RepID=UPI00379063B7